MTRYSIVNAMKVFVYAINMNESMEDMDTIVTKKHGICIIEHANVVKLTIPNREKTHFCW
jgi:hypothetical protein